MRTYLIAAVALLSGSAATAADFTGPWIEARGGWDSVQNKVSINGVSISDSKSGIIYGAAAGLDVAVGKSVIAGVQLGGYGATTKECSEVFGLDEFCLKAGRDLEILARLGVKATGDLLIYGLAGYANGRATATYIDFENILDSLAERENFGGLRVGAGAEQAYGKVFAKAEYRYTSYSKTDLGLGFDAGFNRHQVLVGVGYRF